MWEIFFSKATLHFIDVNPLSFENYGKNLSTRSNFYILDQSNVEQLENFAKKINKGFDIIIDDGGHTMSQQITSFTTLFPYLNSKGIYIIEDLLTSYLIDFGGNGTTDQPVAGPNTTIEFLKNLIDEINYGSARTYRADIDKWPKELKENLNIYKKDILSIHFYSSLCFIFKR